ncbi:hypothetical protein GUH10_18810, partial [Xanthomonas citri pv. citri]|nr:hypothetical protein [Xanthomonas citri pv. citri]
MTAFGVTSDRMAALPFSAVLLRGESATSSQIENLTVHARKLSLAAVGAHVGGNAELVAPRPLSSASPMPPWPHSPT